MKIFRLEWRWLAAEAGKEQEAIVAASNAVAAARAWTEHKEGAGFDRLEIIGVQKLHDVDLIASE